MDDTGDQSTTSSKSSGPNMMIISAVVVVLILLGIGGYYVMNKSTTQPAQTTSMKTPKPSPTSASMFTSIQNALSKSLSLKCEYTNDKTGAKTVAYLKAGAIRGDVTGAASENSSFIMKDKKIWFWSGKKGMMMEFDPTVMMKRVPSVSPSTQKPSTQPNGANMMEELEKFKQHCSPSTVADSLFVAPTDVTFQDLSKMMPSGVMMPKTSGLPPSGATSKQMQELQKQMKQKYANPSPSGQ